MRHTIPPRPDTPSQLEPQRTDHDAALTHYRGLLGRLEDRQADRARNFDAALGEGRR